MTIDKFGRSLKSQSRGLRGPKGEGFNLTPDGNFNIEGKRLINLGIPIAAMDAVNKMYMDYKVIPLQTEGYNVLNKRLRYVDDAVEDGDAVNLQTLKRQCLTYEGENFNARGQKITNLNDPIDPKDAVTKEYTDGIYKNELAPLSANLAGLILQLRDLGERILKCEILIVNNKDYHDKNLNKFAALLLKRLFEKQTGRSATSLTDGKGDYLNWEVLLKNESLGKETEEEAEEEISTPATNSYDIYVTEKGLAS